MQASAGLRERDLAARGGARFRQGLAAHNQRMGERRVKTIADLRRSRAEFLRCAHGDVRPRGNGLALTRAR